MRRAVTTIGVGLIAYSSYAVYRMVSIYTHTMGRIEREREEDTLGKPRLRLV
jgi:hypothetical protein